MIDQEKMAEEKEDLDSNPPEASGAPDKSNVVDLTREEILEFENLELKLILANKEIERLRSLQRDLAGRLQSRSGADLASGEWRLDLGAGLVVRTE